MLIHYFTVQSAFTPIHSINSHNSTRRYYQTHFIREETEAHILNNLLTQGKLKASKGMLSQAAPVVSAQKKKQEHHNFQSPSLPK